MNEKKVILHLSETQSEVVKAALDLVTRLGMGQFDAIDRVPFLMNKGEEWERKEPLLEALQNAYYPGTTLNGSHSIRSEKTEEFSKIAYDLYQVMAYEWAKEQPDAVHQQRKPLAASAEPLCQCNVIHS